MVKRRKSRKKKEQPGDKYLLEAKKFARRELRRKREAAKAEANEPQPTPAYLTPKVITQRFTRVTPEPVKSVPMMYPVGALHGSNSSPKPPTELVEPLPIPRVPPQGRKAVREAPVESLAPTIRTVSSAGPGQEEEVVGPLQIPNSNKGVLPSLPLADPSQHTTEETQTPTSPICPLLDRECLGPWCMWFVHVGCVLPEVNRQVSEMVGSNRSLYLMLDHLMKELQG